MASSTDNALKTFNVVMAELNKSKDKPQPADREPFRIRDYGETAAEITRMTEQLNTLLANLQPLLSPESLAKLGAQAEVITASTEARGRELVDYAYFRLLQLLAAAAILALTAALAFRYLSLRMARAG
jgi:hypothetical protein